ncbi:HAMP domain-containing sensor histidine kinase [Phascolarctobacterium faecium]|nr:HAMP domain-containing sensor histidine kinase [Phascolarctobacterium faecium]MDM8109574.1 HAMP domain-containing sensor histidine kinase [Phascolarctobacterium faecium]
MFDKLKKRLTLIYTGIFSLIMVFVVAVTVAIGCISVLRTEKDMLIADIYDEWREWIGSGELPVDPALVKKGEMMSLMYDADGNIIIDQMTDSPYAAALTAIRASWPEPENETELLYFRDKNGTLHFFLAGGCTFWENGQIQARLYTFLNLEDYYDMAVDGMYFLFLLCAVCIMLAAGGGYYMAAKNIKPLEILFAREHEFAADASHELRTPLTVLSLGVESLQNDDESKLSGFAQEVLRDMQHETKYMSRLIEALLTLARGDEENTPLARAKVDLTEVAVKVCNKMRPLAAKKGLGLEYAAGDAPQVFILGDKNKMEQLLIIFIDNAIKYSESGTITVTVEADSMHAVIKVMDEGIGISESDAQKIFERFYRVDKARSRAAGGFGLGLNIARIIVVRHGGTVSVKPRSPHGSIFTVRLPLYR